MKYIFKGLLNVIKNIKYVLFLFAFYVITYILFFSIFKTPLSILDNLDIPGESISTFNYSYLFIILQKNISTFSIALSFLLVFFIIYFFFSQYIVKGFTEQITEQQSKLKNYRKILLTWLYFLPVFFVVYLLLFNLPKKSRELMTVDPGLSPILSYLFIFLSIIIGIYLFSVLDISRITSIYKNKNSFFSYLKSYKFVLRHYLNFLLIYLFYGILTALLLYIYTLLTSLTENQRWDNFILLIFFHLLFFLVQLFIKFSIFASEFEVLKSKIDVEKPKKGKEPEEETYKTQPISLEKQE